jgi:hypothetical protein
LKFSPVVQRENGGQLLDPELLGQLRQCVDVHLGKSNGTFERKNMLLQQLQGESAKGKGLVVS